MQEEHSTLAVIADPDKEGAGGILLLFDQLKNVGAAPEAVGFLITIANSIPEFNGRFAVNNENVYYIPKY